MKKIVYGMFVVMAILLAGRAVIYAQPLRLHILANSDAAEDQQVKLLVRDAILQESGEKFTGVISESGAEACVRENLEKIIHTANAVLRQNGFDYTASAELGSFDFPTRRYADRTYPAGKYRALRITLGRGAGHNWWCVLYPPLCTADVGREDAEIKSYLIEWLKGVFG